MVTGLRKKEDVAKIAVASQPIHSDTRHLRSRNRNFQFYWAAVTNRDNVRRYFIPFLNHEALRLKEGANLHAFPAHNFLKDGNQYSQRVRTQHGALRNRRQVLVL